MAAKKPTHWTGTKPLKKGVLGNDEKAYVDNNFRTKSIEEMAAELNRSPSLIEKYVLEQGGLTPNGSILTGLRTRLEWDTFRTEFNDDELKTFEYFYIKYMGQFGADDGMLPTEERQVFSLIKTHIYENRIARELNKINDKMRQIELEQDGLREAAVKAKVRVGKVGKPSEDVQDYNARMRKLDSDYKDLSQGLKDVSARYRTNELSQSQIIKDLKGSRDQRVKMIEDSKKSYTGLIRMLMEEDFRLKQEEQMKMASLAAVKAKERLSRPHKYADEVYDQPILTPDTLIDDYSPYVEEDRRKAPGVSDLTESACEDPSPTSLLQDEVVSGD